MSVEFLKLENILAKVIHDPRYIEGITYGVPRKGHEEGTVDAHIHELEGSLGKLSSMLTNEETLKLLILIHVHDTFKLAGKRLSDNHQVSLRDPRSHPMLARQFLNEFTNDESLLAIVQYHDEGHALWKQEQNKGRCNLDRLTETIAHIPDLELFLLFTVLDGHTVSKRKDHSPKWFLDLVHNHTLPAKPYRAYAALELLEAPDAERTSADRILGQNAWNTQPIRNDQKILGHCPSLEDYDRRQR